MRLPIITLVMLIVFAPITLARPALQEQTARSQLPTADALGPGWSVLDADATAVTDIPPALRDAARATYAGPKGARAEVQVMLVAEGMTAIRDSWDLGNDAFDRYSYHMDEQSGAEGDLQDLPLPNGCADGRRTVGADEVLGTHFPAGVSLCAADPDMIIVTYVSGVVDGQTGYRASDRLVALVLQQRTNGSTAGSADLPSTASAAIGAIPASSPVTTTTGPVLAPSPTPQPTCVTPNAASPLPDFLPTQAQVPAGLIMADEEERSKQDVAAALGGTDEAIQLLDDWGWSGNAFRDFVLPQDAEPGPSGTTFLNVSVHRFADANSAAKALIFWSDHVVVSQDLQDVEAPRIGENTRLLTGEPDGVPLAILYLQSGPFMYRVGGSGANADSDPRADVVSVAKLLCLVRENSATPPPFSAAEATIAAQATTIAQLQAQQANAQVTATALAVVAANSVLDPNQQNITIQTDLNAMLGGNKDALQQARQTLNTTLSRYPPGCRAGFALVSGNAPDIDQGIQLAQRVESLLREVRPDIFTDATGFEHFAQPGVEPFGEVTISVFYYSGCEPIT